jgi:hypothetical protein
MPRQYPCGSTQTTLYIDGSTVPAWEALLAYSKRSGRSPSALLCDMIRKEYGIVKKSSTPLAK